MARMKHVPPNAALRDASNDASTGIAGRADSRTAAAAQCSTTPAVNHGTAHTPCCHSVTVVSNGRHGLDSYEKPLLTETEAEASLRSVRPPEGLRFSQCYYCKLRKWIRHLSCLTTPAHVSWYVGRRCNVIHCQVELRSIRRDPF